MNQALNLAVIEQLEMEGALTPAALERAKNISKPLTSAHGELKSLLNSGVVPEKELAISISAATKLGLIYQVDFPEQALRESTSLARFLKEHEALPLGLNKGRLDLIMSDPSNTFIIKVLEAKLDCQVRPYIGIRSEIISHLNRLYSEQPAFNVRAQDSGQDTPKDLDNESPLVQGVHKILQNAVSQGASDIHFEPNDDGLQVRLRVNGLLRTTHKFTNAERKKVIARLKLMSKLDVTQNRLAQNGRFQFPADGRILDFRVSTLPLHNGESVVLRLLEAQLGQASLDKLGFRPSLVRRLTEEVTHRQGLILVTGPTGSGKSTTLYSLLSLLNQPDLKLISIEDPVEINLPNVNQIQIDEEYGVGFAAALKSVLRQDPDIIMVGEIRDVETAQLAAQAALTGHLVLATLHTNSAIAAISRLRNFGLPDFLIDSSVRGILAQRLLRTKCDVCRGINHDQCQNCSGSGFDGRTTVAEYLPFREHHTLQTPSNELNNQLLDGMTMHSDANRLLKNERTTEREIHRILGSVI